MNLSGGERQRVAIARALSVYPPVLLADEPTGNLDTATGAEILKLIHDLHERLGATVLMVTHDPAVAESCARTIHIRDGQIHRGRPPVMLLRLISWPYVRKHLLRSLTDHSSESCWAWPFSSACTPRTRACWRVPRRPSTASRVRRSCKSSAGEAGLRRIRARTVQNLPEVRAAAPVIEATVAVGKGNLLILGVDMLGDRNLRSYDLESTDEAIDDPLVFLAQPDSLLITKTIRDRKWFGARTAAFPCGPWRRPRVHRARHHEARRPGQRVRRQPGHHGHLRRAEGFRARPQVRPHRRRAAGWRPLSDGRAKLRDVLGRGFEVELPSSRGEQFEATSRIYSLASNITSMFALFIGMFIIYNTFAIAVTQRRSEIGILRALGATRSQIRTLFLTESAVAGLIGTLVGVASASPWRGRWPDTSARCWPMYTEWRSRRSTSKSIPG